MAVINEMLEEQQQEIESQPSSFIAQITELLREINQLLSNPVVASRIAQNVSPNPNYVNPQPQQQEFNEEQFIQFIQTPKGREMLIKGLERVKEMFGDLKISEMIQLLKGENNVRPNQ